MSYYEIINNFGFTCITPPHKVFDAIIIKCEGVSDCISPIYNVPYHSIDEYVEYINKNNIKKAVIIMNDISFITRCPSLECISVIPSNQSTPPFDFSPLYQVPKIKKLSCHNTYGRKEEIVGEIDFSKIQGLVSLGVCVNAKTLNLDKVETLKTLHISGFKGKHRNLTDLSCSKELDTLRIIVCGVQSLDGIEQSEKMQCLYLDYNRSLSDISALKKVKSTLKALHIDSCGKIKDFSVLEELDNLECLFLEGNNEIPSLSFIKNLKNLKTLICTMNVLDGDLTPCLNLSYCHVKNRRHYNLKDDDLPKGKIYTGKENIEEWRQFM